MAFAVELFLLSFFVGAGFNLGATIMERTFDFLEELFEGEDDV